MGPVVMRVAACSHHHGCLQQLCWIRHGYVNRKTCMWWGPSVLCISWIPMGKISPILCVMEYISVSQIQVCCHCGQSNAAKAPLEDVWARWATINEGMEQNEWWMRVRADWACSVHDFHQILRVFNTAMEAKPSNRSLCGEISGQDEIQSTRKWSSGTSDEHQNWLSVQYPWFSPDIASV